MRVRLERREEDAATVTLAARVRFDEPIVRLAYPTRTGALVRIGGAIAGAFDGKHPTIDLNVTPGDAEISLTVEKRSLPTAGLPAGDGVRWRWMLARAEETPHLEIELSNVAAHYGASDAEPRAAAVAMVGHAHLDVAWLWTFAETRRKALRTFATALRQIALDDRYVFAQSQPQLYAFVHSADKELFARIRDRIGAGWDASVASMWVEPDLHAPSGESVLRQFSYGVHFMREHFGIEPDVVWLPDTFGFPSTLPTLAVHAGMKSFATTKLQWNETTRWPYPQFSWYGDDGSHLPSAVIDRYDGTATDARKATAQERNELLIHGFGDGGGGVTDAELAAEDRATRPWTTVARWFEDVDHRVIPEYRGELYLETHRGTYTTHRDIKARNAAHERALAEAEELVAWLVAVRAPAGTVKPLVDDMRNAWTMLLRNQFHDVMAGTSIAAVYDDVRGEHEHVERIAARVSASARSVLPRGDLVIASAPLCEPRADGDEFVFENELLAARVRKDGTIVELRGIDGPNLAAVVNGLALYEDRPRSWDAWNLDARYQQRPKPLRPTGARIEDGALIVELAGKDVAIAMRIALGAGEPYIRIEPAVRWNPTHRVLRAEHRFAIRASDARFGQPHGTLVRPLFPETPAERAKFEVPAQRFVHVTGEEHGVALFSADIYGWSAMGFRNGGVRIGSSLLRSPAWPDPTADRGDHQFAYAIAPTSGATIGALEAVWRDYAEIDRVRLFTCDDSAVLVVATKPADDGDGVILRVRECDGANRDVAVRCGGRFRTASPVDACERTVAGSALIDGELLRFVLPAFALRAFRVRP